MAKAFLVRHQHGHANTDCAFANPPTRAQQKAVLDHDDDIYGKRDPEWDQHPAVVMEIDLISDGSLPFSKTEKP
jgi:hypothetical protein